MARTTTTAGKPKSKPAPAASRATKPAERTSAAPATSAEAKAKASAVTASKAEPRKAAPLVAAKSKAKAATPPGKPAKATAKAAAPPLKPAKAPVVTLKHLAAGISESHGMPRRDAEAFATALIEGLVEQVKGGARVRIAGLGLIEIKDRASRMGRNPATGEPVQIAASRRLAFRPAKELKAAV